MTDHTATSDTNDEKQPRFRSPPYPAIPLNKAIERAVSLHEKALHHPVPVGVAAKAWEYGEKSSGLFATIAALKQFGLLQDDGSGDKRRFKLTDSAIRLIRDPDPNSEKRKAAVRAAALAPKIHAELWEKYGLPGASGGMDLALKSYLTLDRADSGAATYSDKAAEELVTEYRQTVGFAGLLESPDVSLDDAEHEDTSNLHEPEDGDDMNHVHQEPPAKPRDVPSPPPAEDAELNDIRVEFAGGKVRINAVMDLEGLEKLEQKIAAYKAILS